MEFILGRGGGVGLENEVDSCFKINILLTMADSIPYFVPTQFQESVFPSITRPKIPALRQALSCYYVGNRKSNREGRVKRAVNMPYRRATI
jgi:hypothetical protein